jgi:hypothetical protein
MKARQREVTSQFEDSRMSDDAVAQFIVAEWLSRECREGKKF